MRIMRNQSAGDKPKERRRKPGEPIKKRGPGPDPNPRPNAPGRHPTKLRTTAVEVLPPVQLTQEQLDQDRRDLELIVTTALHSGMGPRTAALLIVREHTTDGKPRWVYDVVWQCIRTLQALWAEDFEGGVQTYRARQVERLQQDMARERARPKPSLIALKGHEELLARITGTLKPVKVEVDVMATLKQSLAVVIADLSEAEKDAIVAEQLELEQRVYQLPPQAAE